MLQYSQTHIHTTHTDKHIYIESYIHTNIFSPSLHAVPHIQGTKVREHHLTLEDITHTVQLLALSLQLHWMTFSSKDTCTNNRFFVVITFFFNGFHTVFIGFSFLSHTARILNCDCTSRLIQYFLFFSTNILYRLMWVVDREASLLFVSQFQRVTICLQVFCLNRL